MGYSVISVVITCRWGGLDRIRFIRIKNGFVRGYFRERYGKVTRYDIVCMFE